MVKLLILLFSVLNVFVISSSLLDCRIIGLDHLLNVLESKSNLIVDGHTVKWIVIAKRFDLLDRFMPPYLEGNQIREFLKASLHYFPPEIQSKIMGEISERAGWLEGSFKKSFLSNLSNNLIHQYALVDFAGQIKRFPREILDVYSTYLGSSELINLACTCWHLHDYLAPKCRDRLCIFDPKEFKWRLSVTKIYKHWVNADFDKDGTRLFLEKNLNVSFLRGPLFFSERFSSVKWDLHHGPHRLLFRRNGANLNDWIKEQHHLISRDLFETILITDLGNQVSWSTFEALVSSKCSYRKLKLLLIKLISSCEFDENLPHRVYNSCPVALSLQLIHYLGRRDSTLNAKNLSLLFKLSKDANSVVKLLSSFKVNLHACPTESTLERLFNGNFEPDFLRLFFRKLYPSSQIEKDLVTQIRSLKLPADLLHTISLLCSGFRPKFYILESYHDMDVDVFMAQAVKSPSSFPDIIVDAMGRKYPETHIKVLLRLCAPALKQKFMNEIIAAALINGYSEDFCKFIKEA